VERLRRRVGALTPQARAAVEAALRARAEHLRAARAIADLTPTEARTRRAEIAAELRRRLATGQIADPEERKQAHMAAAELERTRPDPSGSWRPGRGDRRSPARAADPRPRASGGRRGCGPSWEHVGLDPATPPCTGVPEPERG